MHFSTLKFHLNAAEHRSARPPSRPLFNNQMDAELADA